MLKEKPTKSILNLTEAIFIVFLILKLTGIIDWSWWWITCPLWIGLAFVFIILGFAGIALLTTIIYKIIDGKK